MTRTNNTIWDEGLRIENAIFNGMRAVFSKETEEGKRTTYMAVAELVEEGIKLEEQEQEVGTIFTDFCDFYKSFYKYMESKGYRLAYTF